MRIGFIGAGMMGRGMASNLMKHGHEVWVIAHRNREPIDDLVRQGAYESLELDMLAHNAEALMLCLSNAKLVEETIGRLKPRLKPGQMVIDTGTSDPETTRKLARELKRLGVAFADAPVTGGPEQAAAAELGVLVGAEDKTFERIKPLLQCYSGRIRHFGPPGSGQVAKIISNFVITGMIALVREAFGAAHRETIDWADLYEVMLMGSGNSGVLRKMLEPALKGDFEGYRFSIANAAKDIGYYCAMREPTPLAEAVANVFTDALAQGHGGRNVSHLLDPAIDDVT